MTNLTGPSWPTAGTTALILIMLAPAPAIAEPDLILDARLRYESVDQDGLVNSADALTLRTRIGVDSGPLGDFRFLIEAENVLHLVDDFNSTTNGNAGYPVIADPEETELNRAQLAYTGLPGTTVTLGRQRVILGDARYVGNVGFRQNEQTFDTLRITHDGIENLTLNYLYLDRANRIFGDDHPAGEWDLDAHLISADAATSAGTLSGFAYLVENQDAAALSTATYGVRWQGRISTEDGPVFAYFAEYAHQSSYGNNPASFDLNLFRAQASVAHNGFSAALGLENLEGDGMRGFATPLATLHAYQGWADVFLNTPASGIRDLYVRGGWAAQDPPFGQALTAAVIVHSFEAQNGGGDLGSEIDAVVTARLTDHWSLELKGAFYDGPTGGPAGRDKIWLALTVSY